MRKTFLYFFIMSTAIFYNHQSFGKNLCTLKGCTTQYGTTNIASPGCRRLNVTIINKTNYTFKADSTIDSSPAYGTLTGFPNLALGTNSFSIDGTTNGENLDEVDRTVHYIAYTSTNVKVGTSFTLHLVKSSCNVSSAQCYTDTHSCCDWTSDLWGNKSCWWNSSCTCKDCVDVGGVICFDVYVPCRNKGEKVDCHSSRDTVNSSTATFDRGLYSPSSINNDTGRSHFACTKETICQGSSVTNIPAQTSITVSPSPIETLTITFPFNAKSPAAKIMKDSIYNNLNAKYVGLLGTYFSYTPVEVKDNTLAFSTLCNSASCP